MISVQKSTFCYSKLNLRPKIYLLEFGACNSVADFIAGEYSIKATDQRFQYKEKQLVILREVVTRFLKTSFWFTAAAAAGKAK